jgi:hypothetical protein
LRHFNAKSFSGQDIKKTGQQLDRCAVLFEEEHTSDTERTFSLGKHRIFTKVSIGDCSKMAKTPQKPKPSRNCLGRKVFAEHSINSIEI